MTLPRRTFLRASLASGLVGTLPGQSPRLPRRIVLRSSWQTVNIGDVVHTPGVLALLEKQLPQVEVRLWPSNVGDGVEAMLRQRFPRLEIVRSRDDVRRAFDECDFLLHGSGPSLVAEADVVRWRTETRKPYGVFGITLPSPRPATLDTLSGARFVFFRDSVSLQLARDKGCGCPIMEFGPDGAFSVDLRNDAAAEEFLARQGLETGKFLCVIPRLRNTPYWTIHKQRAFDDKKHARNEELKEHDHAPLREAIVEVARRTEFKLLVCPEDQTQMAVGKELLVEKLPSDVRARVVWREKYWLTDEAVSTYVRSAGLFGNEMHSPIMCVGNGVPAIVCRWAEQTSKGIMWRDIGLGEWLFDHDRDEPSQMLVPAVLRIATQPDAARAKVEQARAIVRQRQQRMITVLSQALGVER